MTKDKRYMLGYWRGRLDELNNNMPITSKNWWVAFLTGIAFGLCTAIWVIGILK